MRQQVATWLLEVCEEEDLRPPTFPQAIQIFDRFLSNQAVSASELQLLAATCLFIASKGESLSPTLLDRYSGVPKRLFEPPTKNILKFIFALSS